MSDNHRTLGHLGKVSYLATFWCQLSRKAVGIQIVEKEHVRYSRFSHDVTAAMLEPLNKETAAMLEPRPNPWEFNSIIMQTFSFVFVEKHGC